MKIKAVNSASFLQLVHSADNADIVEYAGDVAVDIEVHSSQGFCGKCNEVWFQRSILDEFVESLQAFESTRRGVVTLSACPESAFNKFELKLSANSSNQSILAEIQLLRVAYTPNDKLKPFSVSVHFSVDSSMLHSIITDFRKLFGMKPR